MWLIEQDRRHTCAPGCDHPARLRATCVHPWLAVLVTSMLCCRCCQTTFRFQVKVSSGVAKHQAPPRKSPCLAALTASKPCCRATLSPALYRQSIAGSFEQQAPVWARPGLAALTPASPTAQHFCSKRALKQVPGPGSPDCFPGSAADAV